MPGQALLRFPLRTSTPVSIMALAAWLAFVGSSKSPVKVDLMSMLGFTNRAPCSVPCRPAAVAGKHWAPTQPIVPDVVNFAWSHPAMKLHCSTAWSNEARLVPFEAFEFTTRNFTFGKSAEISTAPSVNWPPQPMTRS